jgi:hypothetical protein
MAFTLDQLTALDAAIAGGMRSVTYSGPGGTRTITYGSLDEMIRTRDLMRAELGVGAPRGRRYLDHDKGV